MTPDNFEALAAELGVSQFDLMLCGDGSGNFVHTECGWACMSYYRPSRQVKEHFGGASGGTNNYAELMPYIHVLWAFHSAWSERNPDERPRFTVLIVSDSELTVNCGTGKYSRKANLALWASIDWFVSKGYKLVWRHVRRNTNPMNKRADKVAGAARHSMVTLREP